MTKLLLNGITIILLLAANIVFPSIHHANPNFLFLFMLFVSFSAEDNAFLWVAFAAGILLDVVSAPIFGSYLISFVLIAMLVNYATKTFFSSDPNPLYMAFVVFISNLFLVGSVYLINGLAYNFHNISTPLSPVYLSQKVWFDILLDLIFAVPIYFIVSYEEGIIERQEAKSKQ